MSSRQKGNISTTHMSSRNQIDWRRWLPASCYEASASSPDTAEAQQSSLSRRDASLTAQVCSSLNRSPTGPQHNQPAANSHHTPKPDRNHSASNYNTSNKHKRNQRQSSMLREPDSEDEAHADAAEAASKSARRQLPVSMKSLFYATNADEQCSERKSQHRHRLTPLLVMLFVLLVFVGFALAAERASMNSTATGSRSQPSSGSTIAARSTVRDTSTTTTTSTTTANSLDKNGADEEDLGESENENEAQPSSSGDRMRILINEAAGEVADKLVASRRPSEDTDGSALNEDEADNQDQPEALDDRHKEEDITPSAAPVMASNNSSTTTTNNSNSSTSQQELDDRAQLARALETYGKWRSAGNDIIELFSRKLLPVIMEHGYEIDGPTMVGLLQVFNGIRGLKSWPLKLLDASAKLSPGVLLGTQADFGDFDECLNVRADDPSGNGLDSSGELDPATGLPSSTVVGRYCLADVEFPKPPRERPTRYPDGSLGPTVDGFAPIELRKPLLNFNDTSAFKDTIFVETGNFFNMLYVDPLRLGICLTNKIDPDSFAGILNKLIESLDVRISFKSRCVTKYDKRPWSMQQVWSAYLIAGASALVIISTLLDILHNKLHKLPLSRSLRKRLQEFQTDLMPHRPAFTCFSLLRNTRRLFRPARGAGASLHSHSVLAAQASCIRLAEAAAAAAAAADCATGKSKGSRASPWSSLETSPWTQRRRSSSSIDSSTQGSSQSEPNTCDASSMSLMANSSAASVCHQKLSSKHQHNLALAGVSLLNNNNNNININNNCPSDHTNNSAQQANLACLHGIRVITMIWMIVNHTYMFGGFFVLWAHRRLIDIAEWPKSISFQFVLNGWLTVETYFFLSATIIVLNIMPLMRGRKFSYPAYVFHRLVRLLPAYTGLIALNFLWPLVSSGPVWLVKGKSFIETPCENYIWANFLFINNWMWPEKQCMVHTWFLSADFQLYLVAPIVVYLLYRRPVLGHTVNIIVAILASVLSGVVIYAHKLLPTTLINRLEFDYIKQQLSYSYFATYQHLGPYCLGIFVGYLLHRKAHVRLPKHLTWALWLTLPPLSFTTLLLTYLWNGAYGDPELLNPSPLVSAFYVAIHRTIWSSLLAWLVFACATGRAKTISSFLSHRAFEPLSRLSYSIYLVHLPVIMFRALNLRHTIEWTDTNILWEACGNFVASVIVGFFLNIAFESPFSNMEQVLMGTGRSRETASLATTTTTSIHRPMASDKPARLEQPPEKNTKQQSGQILMRARNSLQPQSSAGSAKTDSDTQQTDSDNISDKSSRHSTGSVGRALQLNQTVVEPAHELGPLSPRQLMEQERVKSDELSVLFDDWSKARARLHASLRPESTMRDSARAGPLDPRPERRLQAGPRSQLAVSGGRSVGAYGSYATTGRWVSARTSRGYATEPDDELDVIYRVGGPHAFATLARPDRRQRRLAVQQEHRLHRTACTPMSPE